MNRPRPPLIVGQSLCSGRPLRLVSANSSSCRSLIDASICFDAPFSLLLGDSPRLAESAAPAAFCCAFDFAGMAVSSGARGGLVGHHPGAISLWTCRGAGDPDDGQGYDRQGKSDQQDIADNIGGFAGASLVGVEVNFFAAAFHGDA